MITLTREEAQQVPLIEQLESVPEDARMIYEHSPFESENIPIGALCREAAKALRAKLSEPEQEPVAWTTDLEFDYDTEIIPAKEKGRLGTSTNDIPLYTAPPQREWQGLTDEEIMSLLPGAVRLPPGWADTVRAIEQALKEKNT